MNFSSFQHYEMDIFSLLAGYLKKLLTDLNRIIRKDELVTRTN